MHRELTRVRGEVESLEAQLGALSEQVALETRTRMLNPKWYEGMLEHGYEGVRHIEVHVTNIMGWSATTGQVAPWVYQRLTETYVLDDAMRARLAALNPTASAKVASRLIEAHELPLESSALDADLPGQFHPPEGQGGTGLGGQFLAGSALLELAGLAATDSRFPAVGSVFVSHHASGFCSWALHAGLLLARHPACHMYACPSLLSTRHTFGGGVQGFQILSTS